MSRFVLVLAALLGAGFGPAATAADRPNIVLIYADDIGYGDLSCYGATKVKTPNCDRLAAGGHPVHRRAQRRVGVHAVALRADDRRVRLPARRAPGSPPACKGCSIDPGRTTLPSVLRKAGYRTGVVGKWHLGLGDDADQLQRRDQAGAAGGRLRLRLDPARHRGPRPVRLGRERPRGEPRPEGPDQARLHREARRQGVVRQRRPADRRADRRQGGAVEGRRDVVRDRREELRLHRGEQGQAVLPVHVHAQHPRAPRAEREVQGEERLRRPRGRHRRVRLDGRAGARQARASSGWRRTRWSSSPATTAGSTTTTGRTRSTGSATPTPPTATSRTACSAARKGRCSRAAPACRSSSAGRRR